MGTKNLLAILMVFSIVFVSCTTTNKVAYFQNTQDKTYDQVLSNIEAPLQSHDFLKISISSKDAAASAIFNPFPQADAKTKNAAGGEEQYVGYLIDDNGFIEIPYLGKLKVAGITKTQLKELIIKEILDKKLLLNPIVEIRYLNFEVTVLGEVARPAVISVPSEKITLVKALGVAGDITIYGKKDNVLLIREENGVRKTRHINLNSSDFLNSEYYYLHPNDVVYVEPNKAKVAVSGRSAQVLPLVLTSISILVFVLDKVIK
jgi:polysaccharide biosynthesis/export protein